MKRKVSTAQDSCSADERSIPPQTSNRREPSTIASWAKLIARTVDSYGIDSAELFRDAGIDLSICSEPDARIPVNNMTHVWKLAVERTGDPAFALRLPNFFQASVYGPLGLFIMSSHNLVEAGDRALRYSRLTSDAVTLRNEFRGELTEFIYAVPPGTGENNQPAIAGEALEAFVATAVALIRQLVGDSLTPVAVYFSHDKSGPDVIERYRQFFDAPVYFNATDTKLVYARAQLEQACISPNPAVARALDTCLQDSLQEFEGSQLARAVRRCLREQLAGGKVSQQKVAEALGFSQRGLQRRLNKDNLSYSTLLEETRRDMALNYLDQKKLSLSEITFLLGFSDQSNFSSAFRRWTGQSPQQYRSRDQEDS